MTQALEFRVLGPVEVVRDRQLVPLGGPRQQALLALLLLSPGRPVPAERLVEELWDGAPAGAASTTLRSYVSRLRHALGDDRALYATDGGYVLAAAPDAVDAVRFERLVREGEHLLHQGAHSRAAARLREALDLWRGHAFGSVGLEGSLRMEAERLEENRLHALELRLDAELACGGSGELVGELEALVEEHPFRETFWKQLMLALYRSGRQADALEAYRRVQSALERELGLEPGEELKALQGAILRQDLPEVLPPEERHNLPAPLTAFVGREAEVHELRDLLDTSRLVTLTGVGGAGKTRLALEVARRAVGDLPDGVVFVELASLSAPELVAGHVARAFGVVEQPQRDPVDQLCARLRTAQVLLLLDNCEHLLETCADLVHDLLSRCAGARVLATSRVALDVPGEVDYRVDPLGLPADVADPDVLLASDAVRLFLDRVRAARPRVPTQAADVVAAARISRDLDGLPLALELAAARAKTLSLEEISLRLTNRFRFLVSWRRLTPARHRTLHESLDWSYQLLSPAEQDLVAHVSVFVGGFTAGAAAAMLDDDEAMALELVERLAAASFVLPDEAEAGPRFRMLETIREFAAEQLEARSATEAAGARHADYFVGLLEDERRTMLVAMDQWVTRLGPEIANLRAALARCRDNGDGHRLAFLAKELWRLWWVRGDLREGLGWLESARELGTGTPLSWQGELCEGCAALAWAGGDLAGAQLHAETARQLFEAAADDRGQVATLTLLGHVSLARGDLAAAEDQFQRSRDLAARLDEQWAPLTQVAVALHNLGSVSLIRADLDRAVARYDEALTIYAGASDEYGVAISELYLGAARVEAGEPTLAAGHLKHALAVLRKMGFHQYAAQCLDAVAAVAHAGGGAQKAARLLGAANAVRARTGEAPTVLARLRDREADLLDRELGTALFRACEADGRRLSEDEALDLAERVLRG